MIRAVWSLYRPRAATVLTYMLQNTEYQVGPYLRWFWRTQDLGRVMYRRDLVPTRPARLLRAVLLAGMFLQFSVGIALLVQWAWQGIEPGWQLGLALIVSYPIVWAHLVVVPLALGRWLVVLPAQRRSIRRATAVFAGHPGVRLAVLGSYGKTTMKELLLTVLSEGKKVAATPANKNVSVSHAAFALGLDGDEDVLLLEYGEGRPGDIARFARRTRPTHAVITGLAPAHLERYRTLARAAHDLFSIRRFVEPGQVYANTDGAAVRQYIEKGMRTFNADSALGWKVKSTQVSADGLDFTLAKGKRSLRLHSGLLGAQNVGPLAFVAAFALQLGLSEKQVVAGVARTRPFEHRMEPRWLNGALLVDDTYNGNLEGVRAGTALLAALPATGHKWYVTPGLVGQGRETAQIHHQLGELVAAAKPDVVVLMKNSVQAYIVAGLQVGGYDGEVRIEDDPLEFYTNLHHFVATGDVVLMQNDWTDNYA